MPAPRKNAGKRKIAWRGEGSRRAIVLVPDPKSRIDGIAIARSADQRLEEAVGLALAIDLEIVHREAVRLDKARPSTLFGTGVIERYADLCEALEIELVVVDWALTPIQQRNLERALGSKVIDRTGLILEIFGARASTREGVLQVELAALQYQRSRLVRSWTHLERQRGGLGFIGGPGESQIELDRRLIDERIARLKRELEKVTRTRSLHREARRKVPYPIVSLVGYTNAGKSTLFNLITKSDVMAEDMLFATLDPTMRAIRLPSGMQVILSDTVGFISDLPTGLVAAFRATLEEVMAADLIVHVRDCANEDTELQKKDVLAVLADLGVEDDRPMLEVLNKTDLLPVAERRALETRLEREADAVAVSAVRGTGIDRLLERIDETLQAQSRYVDLTVPFSDGQQLAWLYEHGDIVRRDEEEDGIHLTVRLSDEMHARYRALHPVD